MYPQRAPIAAVALDPEGVAAPSGHPSLLGTNDSPPRPSVQYTQHQDVRAGGGDPLLTPS
eukprot:2245518-Pyramimonas_sp.AAC.1